MANGHAFTDELDDIWQRMHSRWECGPAGDFRDIYIQPMTQHISDFEKNSLAIATAVEKLEEALAALERQISL